MSTTSQKSPQESPQQGPLKRRTRIIQLVFVVLAVLATIALAYWQFSRWNTTSSFQNLGYALQWPAFGVFFIWAYRKYMEYETARFEGDDEAGVKHDPHVMTEIPDDFLPTRPDGTRTDAGHDPRNPDPGAHTDAGPGAGHDVTESRSIGDIADEEKK